MNGELYKVYINNDLWMTLADFWQGQLRSPMHLKEANDKMSFHHCRNGKMDRRLFVSSLAKGT